MLFGASAGRCAAPTHNHSLFTCTPSSPPDLQPSGAEDGGYFCSLEQVLEDAQHPHLITHSQPIPSHYAHFLLTAHSLPAPPDLQPSGAEDGGYFCSLEQVLEDAQHPHLTLLVAAAAQHCPCICDTKDAGDCAFYRLNDQLVGVQQRSARGRPVYTEKGWVGGRDSSAPGCWRVVGALLALWIPACHPPPCPASPCPATLLSYHYPALPYHCPLLRSRALTLPCPALLLPCHFAALPCLTICPVLPLPCPATPLSCHCPALPSPVLTLCCPATDTPYHCHFHATPCRCLHGCSSRRRR